jgi:hypothetical protein
MSKIFHVMYDDDAKVMAAAKTLVKASASRMFFRHSPFTALTPSLG